MKSVVKEAVRKVLSRAADTPNFFDLSDAERLVRMVAMGFELGAAHVRRSRDGTADRAQFVKAEPARPPPKRAPVPRRGKTPTRRG